MEKHSPRMPPSEGADKGQEAADKNKCSTLPPKTYSCTSQHPLVSIDPCAHHVLDKRLSSSSPSMPQPFSGVDNFGGGEVHLASASSRNMLCLNVMHLIKTGGRKQVARNAARWIGRESSFFVNPLQSKPLVIGLECGVFLRGLQPTSANCDHGT